MSYGNIFPYGALTYGQESRGSGDVVAAFHFSQYITVIRIPKQKLYPYGDAVSYGDRRDYIVSPAMANTLQAYGNAGYGGMSPYGGIKHFPLKQLARTLRFTQELSVTVIPKNNIPTYGTSVYGEASPYGSGYTRELFAPIEQSILFGNNVVFTHATVANLIFSEELTHFAATRTDLSFRQTLARVFSNENTLTLSQRLAIQPSYRSDLAFSQTLTGAVAKPVANDIFFTDVSVASREHLADEQIDTLRFRQHVDAEIQHPVVLPPYTELLLVAYQNQYEYLKATRLTNKSFGHTLW